MIHVSPFQVIMLCLMLGAAWVSRRHWRGIIWLSVQAAVFLASSAWWNLGGGQPELVAGLFDALVCVLIYRFGRSLWECWVWAAFLAMLGTNFVYLGHNIAGLEIIPHDAYATLLEVLNFAALTTIGVVSGMAHSGKVNGSPFHPWRTVFGIVRPSMDAMGRASEKTGA